MQSESQSQEQQQQQKSSIFTCKVCKQSSVQVPRVKKEKDPNAKLVVKLSPARDLMGDAKYVVKIGNKHVVGFGQRGASDFTINKKEDRKQAYIGRHEKRERKFWDVKDPSNFTTSSFWAYHLLWQYPTIEEAIQKLQESANIEIKYTKNSIEKHQRKLAKLVKKSGEEDVDY